MYSGLRDQGERGGEGQRRAGHFSSDEKGFRKGKKRRFSRVTNVKRGVHKGRKGRK